MCRQNNIKFFHISRFYQFLYTEANLYNYDMQETGNLYASWITRGEMIQ